MVSTETKLLSDRCGALEVELSAGLVPSLRGLELTVENGLGPVVAKAVTLEEMIRRVDETAKTADVAGKGAMMKLGLMTLDIDEVREGLVSLGADMHGEGALISRLGEPSLPLARPSVLPADWSPDYH